MSDQKILDKLGKIKAHMESAKQLGNESEAQAFAAMLQTLLLKHKLDVTDVQYTAHLQDEPVEEYEVGGGSVCTGVEEKKRYTTVTELAELQYKDLPRAVRHHLEEYVIWDSVEEWINAYNRSDSKKRYELLYNECGIGMSREFPSEKWYRGSSRVAHYVLKNFPDVEVKSNRVAWVEQLASVICDAHSCKFLVISGSSRLILVGRKSDVQIAEYLIVTMQRAAESLSHKEYKRFRSQCRARDDGGGAFLHETHGFKAAWLRGFINRLAQRFAEEKRKIDSQYAGTALVRINKEAIAVRAYLDQKKVGSAKSISGQSTRGNQEGYKRGKAAADKLSLDANAVKEGQANRQLN